MTDMVQQTPDGKVIVRSAAQTYIDTTAHFATDFGVTAPVLPAGATDRIYEPGVRHPCTNGNTIIAGGPMPWTQGDSYITNISTGLANQAARIAAMPPPPPLPT